MSLFGTNATPEEDWAGAVMELGLEEATKRYPYQASIYGAQAGQIEAQTALAQQQLEILNQQQAFNEDYMKTIKPVLDAQSEIILAEAKASQDPAQKAIIARTAELQLAQLEQAGALLPIQKELLQAQLDQIRNGYKATPEQEALIDETIQANLAMGKSDLLDFSQTALEQIRDELAPALGMRPTDTPILDRAGKIQEEATRQYGQLERGLQSAGAEAKLNYPLASAGVANQASQFQQNLMMAQQQLSQQLSQQAAANRLSLAGVAGGAVQGGVGQGLGLASVGPNPLSFHGIAQNQPRTGVMQGVGGLLGGAGGLIGGLGEIGVGGAAAAGAGAVAMSDERVKIGVKTWKFDEEGRRWVTFRYLGDKTNVVRLGVIAQEVFFTNPDAVLIDENGFLNVDYSKLEEAS